MKTYYRHYALQSETIVQFYSANFYSTICIILSFFNIVFITKPTRFRTKQTIITHHSSDIDNNIVNWITANKLWYVIESNQETEYFFNKGKQN